jgi:hypothetical protein
MICLKWQNGICQRFEWDLPKDLATSKGFAERFKFGKKFLFCLKPFGEKDFPSPLTVLKFLNF